jgi:dTDP-glucose 4,6-dehydratase
MSNRIQFYAEFEFIPILKWPTSGPPETGETQYRDGAQVRDWIHVDDHVDALVRILARGVVGEAYAVGARNEWRNLDLIQAICDTLDGFETDVHRANYSDLIANVSDRPGHDRHYAIDPTKAESQLGWRPTQDRYGGLPDTVQWFVDNEPWWQTMRAGA